MCVSGFCIFISIHSLRVEGDAAGVKRTRNILIFQSTPSVWRETVIWEMQRKRRKYFNPLPPCGGRHVIAPNSHLVQYFNPLPPCGGRRFWFRFGVYSEQFQSTPSVWRETAPVIHVTCQCRDFNPRPPCGGRRHGSQGRDGRLYTFQSTPSVWRETAASSQCRRRAPFQSTPSVWRETSTA